MSTRLGDHVDLLHAAEDGLVVPPYVARAFAHAVELAHARQAA